MKLSFPIILTYNEGYPPYISEIHGPITIDELKQIEDLALEMVEEFFTHGNGEYRFIASYVPTDYDDEVPSYWDLEIDAFRPLNWKEEH